jgi:hypothetical protein
MTKILYGALAAIVVAVGGFFGFQLYAQHRVANEVEAAFEQIRATGAKASHGKVSFDLRSRTVTVADIVSESTAQPPVTVKIASVTASGVSQPETTRFSADSIEVTDIEVALAMAAPPGVNLTYKMPRITLKDYSGPINVQRPPASSSFVDIYRFGLEQFAGIAASSITAPSLAATFNFGAATAGSGEIAYSVLAVQGIKDGKIASSKVEGVVFTITTQAAGKSEKLTGNVSNVASYDIDMNAMAALFDPQKANDDQYHRAYRQVSTGPYILTSGQGMSMRIDSMTIDDVALKPSRMQFPALLAMMPQAGAAPPTPAQAREMMERIATLYEGIRIGNAEMRGLSVQTPQGPFQMAAMRLNLENGKIGEFALEGVDARSPKGPVKLERFALKSVDVTNFLRRAGHSDPQKPAPEQALGMISLIEGVEVKGLAAPFKDTGKPVNIDTISLNWGQFVGPIPSQAHVVAKLTTPIDATNPALLPLVAAGINSAAIDFDLGAAWTEAPRTFVLAPVSLELGNLLKASARVSFANVPRGVFSIDPAQAVTMAAQIEAGTLELTLHDLGAVDLVIAQYARSQNVSREAARHAVVDGIRANGATAAANPDVRAAAEALARFVETPGQTLIIKLTPLGKVPMLQLVQSLKTDPLVALAQFRIEASTGL